MGTLVLVLAAILGAASQTAPQAPSPFRLEAGEPARAGDARVVLSAEKPSFFLGENVLVRFCVENLSTTPFRISLGGDYRGGARANRFKVTVTDAAGTSMPDPWPGGFNLGGIGQSPEVKAGTPWCEAIPLMRYARIDKPGRYTVRVKHDLGWPTIPPPSGEIAIDLKIPASDEAIEIVALTATLPKPADARDRNAPTQDYSTLRYPVYLAPLVELARAGNPDVLAGIGSIPTPEATRALIELLRHREPAIARQASQQLAMRLPDPQLDGTLAPRGPFTNDLEEPRRYLRDAAWRPELKAEVEVLAIEWLSSTDPQAVIQGAFMVEAVGTTNSAPALTRALSRALDRTLTLPFEKYGYPRPRGAMQELMRAVNVLLARGYQAPAFLPAPGRPTGFDSPGDAVFWLSALERGASPVNRVEGLRALLQHPIPYVRELAFKRVPVEGPADLFDHVGPALASPNADLQIAALDLVGRAALHQYRPQVAGLVRSADDTMFLSFATNALYKLDGRMEILDIMADRLATSKPESLSDILGQLFNVFADTRGSGGSYGGLKPEDLQALSARWKRFLNLHRADLEAGKQVSLDDPSVSPDLVPPGVTISRKGKPDWPIRR